MEMLKTHNYKMNVNAYAINLHQEVYIKNNCK